MKKTLIIALISLTVLSCYPEVNKGKEKTTNTVAEKSETGNPKKESKSQNPIVLPLLGEFKVGEMNIDSIHEYGAGDCFGYIYQYSNRKMKLAIDSMTCGEYGHTFTYFLVDSLGSIDAVFIDRFVSISNLDGSEYTYGLNETVIDFRNDPVLVWERWDTVSNYLTEKIGMEFKTDTLSDSQTIYEDWDIEYKSMWENELDY